MTTSHGSRIASLSLALVSLLGGCEFSKQLGDDSTSATDDTMADPSATGAGSGDMDAPIPVEMASAAMAAAYCESYFACGCDTLGDPVEMTDPAACDTWERAYFDEQIALGLDAGLEYAPECVAQFIAFRTTNPCAAATATSAEAYFELVQCDLFHGTAAAGETCVGEVGFAPGAESCAPGLVCIAGVCETIKAEGEVCSGVDSVQVDCGFGLMCDNATSPPRCTGGPPLGAACSEAAPCDRDGWCNDGVCEATKPVGSSCSDLFECGDGLCDHLLGCVAVPSACAPIVYESQDSCDAAQVGVADFVDAYASCEVAADCVALDAPCYADATCGSVAVNADYDAETWGYASGALSTCSDCSSDPCAAELACTDGICGLVL
jgi:hypothetical protein